MKYTISCKITSTGVHTFYLSTQNDSYYLFSHNYRRGVNKYFADGVILDRAIDFSRANGDSAIIRTMQKIPTYIKYIEREYDIEVLRKTAQKNAARRLHAA
jgi:hypothetical protein